jgi:DNA-binding MarR family transcriptional regulator
MLIANSNGGRLGERHIAALISLAIAGPATVSELGERLDMSIAHASLVAGDLASAGLVDRDQDERDRRRIIVSVAEAARPTIAEMRDRHAAPLRRFLAELEEEDAERFIDQLTRLVTYMREEPVIDRELGVKDQPVDAEGKEHRQQAPGHRPADGADEGGLPAAEAQHVHEDSHQ